LPIIGIEASFRNVGELRRGEIGNDKSASRTGSGVFVGLMFLMSEVASLKAKRDSSQEAEKLLQRNPILRLRKY
jgi:hypothetical protein